MCVCVGVGTVVWALHSATAWRAAQHPARIHIRSGQHLVCMCMYIYCMYLYLFIYIYVGVGTVVWALQRRGVLHNTLLTFTSDQVNT